jgi:uncharacterized Fe-S center protein
LNKLITKAGIDAIDFKNKYVAIKLHFGEPGNLAFLRPNFAKTVADKVKSLGAMPFLTDSNTLYTGRRNNAIVHMEAAFENGYSPLSTGCHNIIADGLKGTDDVEVPVPGGVYCKTARIGRALMDADVVISLAHFKGHECVGFGGALKNIGMGGGSRAGKMAMHNDGKPEVKEAACIGCGFCVKFCNQGAITVSASASGGKKATIDHSKCVGCGRCIGTCNQHAIENNSGIDFDILSAKIAEYTLAVVHGRPAFYINIVNQVSPCCDCHNENDAAIVPDIGMFASFDPVALDHACIDAVNAAEPIGGSVIGDKPRRNKNDHFNDVHPTTDWRTQLEHAEKIGLGKREYEIVTVK